MNTYTHAIYCHSSYGPTFGSGHNFYVYDNSNSNSNSYVRKEYNYNIPAGANGGHSILTDGNQNFQTTEVEVYLVQWSTRLKEGNSLKKWAKNKIIEQARIKNLNKFKNFKQAKV